MAMSSLLSSAITLAFFAVLSQAAFDTVLQKKCMMLKGKYGAAYIQGKCFVASSDKVKAKMEDWASLHKHCNHLNGYDGHMAHIASSKLINILTRSEVLELSETYMIGGRQEPQCKNPEDPTRACDEENLKKNWFFFDAKGNKKDAVPNDMWLNNEPNNDNLNEYAIGIQRFDNYDVKFNDLDPEDLDRKIICQYNDYIKCADGYTLIRDKCYKYEKEPKTAAESKAACPLASIHDDGMNTLLMILARESDPEAKLPMRFGMTYKENNFANDDGSEVDYYRWYNQNGCGNPTAITKESNGALIFSAISTGEPDIGYWRVVKDSEKLPYICQATPSASSD